MLGLRRFSLHLKGYGTPWIGNHTSVLLVWYLHAYITYVYNWWMYYRNYIKLLMERRALGKVQIHFEMRTYAQALNLKRMEIYLCLLYGFNFLVFVNWKVINLFALVDFTFCNQCHKAQSHFFITIPYTTFDVMLMYHLMFPWWLPCIKSLFTSFDVVLMYYLCVNPFE